MIEINGINVEFKSEGNRLAITMPGSSKVWTVIGVSLVKPEMKVSSDPDIELGPLQDQAIGILGDPLTYDQTGVDYSGMICKIDRVMDIEKVLAIATDEARRTVNNIDGYVPYGDRRKFKTGGEWYITSSRSMAIVGNTGGRVRDNCLAINNNGCYTITYGKKSKLITDKCYFSYHSRLLMPLANIITTISQAKNFRKLIDPMGPKQLTLHA